jgi:hypothetical protein
MPFSYHDYKIEVVAGIYEVRTQDALVSGYDRTTPDAEYFLLGPDGIKHGAILKDEWNRLITGGFIKSVNFLML